MADFTIDDFEYTIIEGNNVSAKVISSSQNKTTMSSLVSPFTYNGVTYTITSMNSCFSYCTNFNQSITIPSSITDMSYCFYECTSLNQSITIPNSVTDMSYCFRNCTSFNQSITIPNSVTDMGHCFRNCSSLNQSIIIGNSVTDMNHCFVDCTSFNQSITIGNSVTDMFGCFEYCINFNQPITIPNSVTDMSYCFRNCTSFNQSITIPNSVTDMGHCFRNCSSLNQSIIIGNSVTDMNHCFEDCTSFNQSITIPNSVTNMTCCFYSCTSFNQPITISDSVTTISSCFYNCTNFNQSITIPNLVTDMSYCFAHCTSFNQSITIPNSVTNMNYCFYNCTAFQKKIYVFNIPTSYTNIISNPGGSFTIVAESDDKQNNNRSIWQTIATANSSGMTLSTTEALYGDFLVNITGECSVLDKSKSSYGTTASVLYVPSIFTIGNNTYNITSLESCFENCTNFNQLITIPNSVTDIRSCFGGCTSFNQLITIPDSVTNMFSCFYNCTSFNQPIIIPNSVTNMSNCFANCTSLNQSITIPNSVTDMSYCFRNCTSLTTFTEMPVAVQSISSCFANCSNLTGIINVKNSPIAISDTVFSGTQKNIVLHIENSDGVNTWKAIAKFYPNVLALEANVDFIDGDYACQFVDNTYGVNYPESFAVTTTGTTLNGVTSSNCIATISVEKTSSEINIKLECSMKLTNSYANTVSFTNRVEAIVTINELALTNVSIDTPLGTIGGNATKTVSNSSIIATLPLDSTVRYISGTLSIQASGGHNNSASFSLLIKPVNIGIKAINTSKVTYEPIPASIVYDNVRYFVTNLNITDSDDSIIGTFSDCVNLNQSLTIPQYVKNMDYCFSGCSALDNTITFVNDCTVSSMKHSFENCFSLNQLISLPATIDEIDGCFDGCASLSKIYVTNSPTTYADLFNNTNKRIDLLCQDITYLSDWESIIEDYPNVQCSMPAVMDLNGIDNAVAFGKRMFDADRLSFYWKTDVYDTLDIIENSALQNALEQLGWNDIII